MFAVVKAGQVTREIKGGPFNADNGIQYPANIFSLWSVDELINIDSRVDLEEFNLKYKKEISYE